MQALSQAQAQCSLVPATAHHRRCRPSAASNGGAAAVNRRAAALQPIQSDNRFRAASAEATGAAAHQRRRTRAAAASGAAAASPSAAGEAQPGDRYFAGSDQRPVILFDGVCNLCNGGVNFMLAVDPQGVYRFAALQSEAGRRLLQRSGRSPDDISSIILVEPQGSYVKSAAILRIASRLRLPLPLLAAGLDLFPKDFKDAVYDQIADNRYNLFGRTQACRLGDPRFDSRFISD